MKPTTEELIDRLKEMNKGSYYYTVIKSNLQGRLDVLEEWKDYLIFKNSKFQIATVNKRIAKIKEVLK